jgi:hypothetical protein
MPNVVFFSIIEIVRKLVLRMKVRAVNTLYSNLNFIVEGLSTRWLTENEAIIHQKITKSMRGTVISLIIDL